MKSIATETKVGIFVILGIVILALFTIQVGKITVREVGYRVYTYVESAAGLDRNSPVRIAGVQVGRVQSIVLEGTKAKVAIHFPPEVKIPVESKLYVKSVGLLGEKYIEVVPGPGPELVKANGTIEEGGPSVDVDRVLTQLSSIGGDIKIVTQSLSRSLGGEKGERTIEELVTGAKETVTNLQNITQTIDRGEGTLGKLVKDETLYKEAKETMANLSQVAKSIERGEGTLGKLAKDEVLYERTKEMMEAAKGTFANLNQIVQKIESGEGTLGKLVNDDSLYTKTKETMEEAKETLANLNKVSKQIESGEGTLGKLVKDETLYDETKRAIKSVNKAAEGIQETTPVTVLGVVLGTVLR
ncbi:MAG: MCE family protein [Deltaproteobacteria bacterium]|nr:MCE family protein [Deltaproteobacteria bacterium]